MTAIYIEYNHVYACMSIYIYLFCMCKIMDVFALINICIPMPVCIYIYTYTYIYIYTLSRCSYNSLYIGRLALLPRSRAHFRRHWLRLCGGLSTGGQWSAHHPLINPSIFTAKSDGIFKVHLMGLHSPFLVWIRSTCHFRCVCVCVYIYICIEARSAPYYIHMNSWCMCLHVHTQATHSHTNSFYCGWNMAHFGPADVMRSSIFGPPHASQRSWFWGTQCSPGRAAWTSWLGPKLLGVTGVTGALQHWLLQDTHTVTQSCNVM